MVCDDWRNNSATRTNGACNSPPVPMLSKKNFFVRYDATNGFFGQGDLHRPTFFAPRCFSPSFLFAVSSCVFCPLRPLHPRCQQMSPDKCHTGRHLTQRERGKERENRISVMSPPFRLSLASISLHKKGGRSSRGEKFREKSLVSI